MKKLLTFLSISLVLNSVVLAQASTTAKPAKTPIKAKLTKTDSLLCGKDWHVVSVEEWAIVSKPPAEINKNDMLTLSLDGTFNLIMFGKSQSGTWSKSGQSIIFKNATTKEEFYFKVLVQEPKKLKVDHFSAEEGHSIFEYEVK